MPDYEVTYIPATDDEPKRYVAIVKDAPSREAVEQVFHRLQDAGVSQLVSVNEPTGTSEVHSLIPFSSINVTVAKESTSDDAADSDFPETFYESDREAARGHAEYPLTSEYIARLERVAKAATGYWWFGIDPALYNALSAINFMDEAL